MISFISFIIATIHIAATFAAPTATFQAFQITDYSIENVFGGDVTIQFTIYNPDPAANATAICTGQWKSASKAYPTGPYVGYSQAAERSLHC